MRQAPGSESSGSLPWARSTVRERKFLSFFLSPFPCAHPPPPPGPRVRGENRGESAGSPGHRGDLEDLLVLSVGPKPLKGFSFTPDYTLDSWEHKPVVAVISRAPPDAPTLPATYSP